MNGSDIWLDIILGIILIMRVLWIISTFSHLISRTYFENKYDSIISMIMDITYDTSTLFVGILIIYLFNHLTSAKVCISGAPKRYLYVFGILSCAGVIQKMLHDSIM